MPEVQCYICDKTFTKPAHLRRHKENVHKICEPKGPSTPSEKIELQFQSMNEFLQWKSEIEEETLSFYSNVRQVKHQTDKYYYYECSRSGIYTPRGKGIRSLKSQKSAKIGKRCPARMNLKVTDSSLFVTFYNVHEGHDHDLQHLRLPSTFRAAVASKLKEGVPMKRIVDDVREETISSKNFDRISLINNKDVQNIKRDYNVENHRHKLDSVSVNLWVQEMSGLANNPILYYKEQGHEDPHGLLSKEDFALILMTPYQKETLNRFGGDKICVDGTHGLNPYDFILHTLLTVDDFGNGFPVGFCFSNRSNEEVFNLFFLKSKVKWEK